MNFWIGGIFDYQQTIRFWWCPDHDADPGNFKGIFTVAGQGQFANFADNSKSFRQILMKSFGGVACLTSKKRSRRFADYDWDAEMLTEFLPLRYSRGNYCKIFATVLGTSLLRRSTVAFTYLKVKSAECLCLLPLVLILVLVLLFWSWS